MNARAWLGRFSPCDRQCWPFSPSEPQLPCLRASCPVQSDDRAWPNHHPRHRRGDRMRRREFTAGLIGAAALPIAARAQQQRPMRRIAVLMGADENDPEAKASVAAFQEELRKCGWVEGRNAEINIRW